MCECVYGMELLHTATNPFAIAIAGCNCCSCCCSGCCCSLVIFFLLCRFQMPKWEMVIMMMNTSGAVTIAQSLSPSLSLSLCLHLSLKMHLLYFTNEQDEIFRPLCWSLGLNPFLFYRNHNALLIFRMHKMCKVLSSPRKWQCIQSTQDLKCFNSVSFY